MAKKVRTGTNGRKAATFAIGDEVWELGPNGNRFGMFTVIGMYAAQRTRRPETPGGENTVEWYWMYAIQRVSEEDPHWNMSSARWVREDKLVTDG